MPQIPLLSGIKANLNAEFARVYPLNLEPVVLETGISKGQLRSSAGVIENGTAQGVDRGGIEWQGMCYRVSGTKLIKVASDGTVSVLGDVGSGGQCFFDYGFDRLAITSGGRLYYWDDTALTQVTDIDLGVVIDVIWISGFYMTSDGTSIVVTELSDPTAIFPLKYGSAEEDPDMVTGLIKVRNEAYAIGRYTIQVLQLVGGNGFPFRNSQGASIPYGCVSASAKCRFLETFAFVGGARGEALGVYVAGQGTAQKISTREIDDALALVSDPESIVCEVRTYRDESRLLVHLPTETWQFMGNGSALAQQPIWFRLQSGNKQPYRPRNAVMCYGKMMVGDVSSAAIGVLDETVSQHFGTDTAWSMECGLVYNGAKGGIVKRLDLTALTGHNDGTVFMSMTRDGLVYSQERGLSMGKAGERNKRMQWRPMSKFSNYVGFRFRGYDADIAGFAALEADIMPLTV